MRFRVSVFAMGLCLTVAACVGALGQGVDGFSVYYVTPDGTGGGGDGPTTDTLQKAISMVDDDADVIKVQAGTYTDAQALTDNGAVATVGRTMTIRGGYAGGDWVSRDPGANQTVLDANTAGIVVYITGGNLTIDGFRMVNGQGIGVSARSGNVHMIHCTVTNTEKSNTGLATGAVQGYYRSVTLTSCSLVNNGTGSAGTKNVSGVQMYYGALTATSCTISGNYNNGMSLNTVHNARIAQCVLEYNEGAGIRLEYGNNCVVTSNTVYNNAAYGVYATSTSNLQVVGNRIELNDESAVYLKNADGTLVGGNYLRQNGHDASDGGGVEVYSSDDVTIRSNDFYNNDASLLGGGVHVQKYSRRFLIENNWFVANSADVEGGAICVDDADGAIRNNQCYGNYGDQTGGAIMVGGDEAMAVTGNCVFMNKSDSGVGGLVVSNRNAIVTSNTIVGNSGRWGGGASFSGANARFENNFVADNEAVFDGGGLLLGGGADLLFFNNAVWRNRCYHEEGTATSGGGIFMSGSAAILVNNVIADNWHGVDHNWGGAYAGAGVFAQRSAPLFVGNTIVNNSGGDGSGIYLSEDQDVATTATFYGTIITSHTIAVRVQGTSLGDFDYTLWSGGDWVNGTDHEILTSGSVTDTNVLSGDPLFADPSVCDFHIANGSGAQDGVPVFEAPTMPSSSSLALDVDAEARPYGASGDAGYDEYAGTRVEVGFASGGTTQSETVANYNVPVMLSGPSARPVYVSYLVTRESDDLSFKTDAWVCPGLLTFAPGATMAYIPVRVWDDTDGEGPERFTLSLVNPRNASIGAAREFVYTIPENDGGVGVSPNGMKWHFIELVRLRNNRFIYADANGDGRVDAADRVWRVLELLVSGRSGGVCRNGATATLDIGDAAGAPGDIVAIPILLSGNTDMAGVHVRLTYDPAVLEWDTGITSYAQAGPLLTSEHNWGLESPVAGRVNFWFGDNGSSIVPFAAQSGTLCTIRMRILASAPGGDSLISVRTEAAAAPGWPVDSCASVSDDEGYSISLTPQGGVVTVAGATATPTPTPTAEPGTPTPTPTVPPGGPAAFDDNQVFHVTSDGHFYALVWNYGTASTLDYADTWTEADLNYAMAKGDWIGVYIYDYAAAQWSRGLSMYGHEL